MYFNQNSSFEDSCGYCRLSFDTYIHTYTLFKLEIQCSCRANIFEKKKKLKRNKNMLSYNFNIIYKLYTTKS